MIVSEYLLVYFALIVVFLGLWLVTHTRTPEEEMADRNDDARYWQAQRAKRPSHR